MDDRGEVHGKIKVLKGLFTVETRDTEAKQRSTEQGRQAERKNYSPERTEGRPSSSLSSPSLSFARETKTSGREEELFKDLGGKHELGVGAKKKVRLPSRPQSVWRKTYRYRPVFVTATAML